jgi:hypothetical protein
MFRIRDAGWFALIALLSVSLVGVARAKTYDLSPPSKETICDDLSGAAFGLCNAYCEAVDCDSRDDHQIPCQMLRRAFEKATGSDIFPCDEVVATPTNTASPTDTPEAPTVTDTPQPTTTDTPEPTGTDTPEPTVTDTPEAPTVTDTPQPTTTDTPEPTGTDTPELTVTDTPTGTPTGTAAATVTDTPEPTVTDTPEPTVMDTPTGTPTGTAAATVTDTPEPTVTDTPVPTVTDTPVPTVTDTPVPTMTDTPVPTATDTPVPTPTDTPAPICPLEEGRYTITQMEGGTLQVSSIGGPDGFPFPPGGTVVQDVGPGDANCVHETVVPATGGFSAPIFCIPGLNFTVQIVQTGCGIGQIDSDGGSDYTVTEVGDTSDTNGPCNLPNAPCSNGVNASERVDITVGDGAADTCPNGGTGNAVVAIPVLTTTWLAADFTCPDMDGMFDPGTDTLILVVPQILDFSTDVSTASWSDIDGDGCSIAGAGPAAGLTREGVCIDTGAMTVSTAATGTIGSNGSPLFDLTFATLLPNSLSGPAPSLGATCATPPVINFAGLATRCIE